MIFDTHIENLKAREGGYGGKRKDAQLILEKILGFFLPAFQRQEIRTLFFIFVSAKIWKNFQKFKQKFDFSGNVW